MRIKNKELRQRRHRKEQKLKDVRRELKKLHENKPAPAPAAVKTAAPKKEAAPKKAAKPKAEATAVAEPEEKPKKAAAKPTAKKKADAEAS